MFTKMNNECINSPKINTSVPSTSTNCSYSSGNSSSSNTTTISNVTTSYSSFSSLPLTSTSYSANSTQFSVTVSAIAAVVNASNHLPVTTPASAAAVVAVAVSSLAAAFIPDTPIVSIAGSTLSEITTTTTSTKTTPTPVPTSQEGGSNNISNNKNHSNHNNVNNNYLEHKTSSSTREHRTSSSSLSTSVKDLNPMSVANSSNTGALTNALTTAANATVAAAETDNNSPKQTKNNFNNTTRKGTVTVCSETVIKIDADPQITTSDSKSFATISPPPSTQPFVNTASPENKTEDINITSNKIKSKDFLSESWEESRLKDWDDSKLKELLDEAYSYKNPRDKENKSKTFLQLLEKAENEDQSYPFRVTSRGSRNLSNSITSNSYHHYQNTHYHSHSQNHNRSHHHHKQGGSLQDLFEIGLHESQLDCDQTFGIGISGNQRTRRQNHNSRQKKYSSSVSSRQREGGSLPSNVNVTINDIGFMQQEGGCGLNIGETTSLNSGKGNKKEQRRNASKAVSVSTSSTGSTETKENNTINGAGECIATGDNTTTTSNTNSSYTDSGGDFIIDMGEPMMDIQQQQKILQTKGQDAATQGHPFYERLSNNDKRIPRANIIGSTKGTYFAPTSSHCYVDETVRFNALERNGGTNNSVTSSTIDAKFLPLDENYKSCKSVLGSDGDKTTDMLAKSKSASTNYTKISSPASSSASAVLSGPTNNIAPLNQRQLDENGNALGEIQQNSSGVGSGSLVWKQINSVSASAANASAALLNSCGNVSTSATVTISPHTSSTTVSTSATVTTTLTTGPSQAKAKAKKKSQQERNTKTVDVESVAGYRGKDPVEELVKYIESSSEDKQGVGSGSKSGDKKKERKKDKEKHQKLKKSNSLEELRSGAKMEVHELKRTAATTESNTVLVRQKSGGGKQNKNNSSSTADINKNLDSKNQTQNGNSRKSDRRSWGNEDLKYLHDQQNANLANEDKTNSAKDRRNKVSLIGVSTSLKDEKETKDKTNDRNELNLTNNISSTIQNDEKLDKIEKSEKFEKVDNKTDKSEKRKKQEIPPNAVTVVDILPVESALPETAEFHVVTKKKKPKKQKVINNLEETTVTFNRTHNFTMQKTSTFNQQQQQMTVRYKYYHYDNLNSTNTSISNNANTNSQYHQHLSSQFQQHQQQQSSNYNSNAGMTNSHHQSQQTTSDSFSNSDKSRRKSTSSVPPSEKSDSSDLDSVHSLPIESTKQTNVSNNLKEGTQLRTKVSKNNNTTLGNNNFTLCKSQNSPAPVSYADIARTNKEISDAVGSASASGILINNNEISTECRNADTTTHNASVTESFNDDKPTVVNTATGVTASTSLSKLHKIKKSQIKQDFPELVGSSVISDDKIVSTSTNHKTITYSQSLTAVKHPNQNATSVLSHGSGLNSANESSPSSSTDFNTKASPTELHKTAIVHQHIPPLQHPQQLILQKSKSVDNDSIALTNSSSSITYMASLNCNNIDQQYPALEKTVKRHSSSNVTLNTNSSNYCSLSSVNITNSATNNQTAFNFAAAAKQQITLSNNEQHNTNLNKNLALTTSNTNNTMQTALQTNANFNVNAVGINVNSGIIGTAMTNKKSKEKTPPLASNSIQVLQNTSQDFNATNSITNTNIMTLSTAATNSKKSKKERLLQQQHVLLDNTQAKQNNNNNNNVSSRKPLKTQLKSSTSLPLGVTTSSSTSSSLTSSSANTISNSRPAVIILNDDRNSTSCAADNQFTFGDFNEEELKLFDDDNNVTENTLETINTNVISPEEEKKHPQTVSDAVTKTPIISYFNDSGTSCGSDMVNNSTSDMLLSSSMEASSPNTSFATISHTVCSGGGGHISGPCNNQSSDSGIYTDKMKSANIICNSSNSSSCGDGNSGNISSKHNKEQQMAPRNEDDNKLNTFLSNTKCTSVQTSIDNLEPPPPPQQLETCNDIETAIIAAARAAAKHQQPAHHQLHQQQQYKNSNASSSSSSFSSSSLTTSSTSSAYHNYHQHHNNNNIKRNYPNQIGSGNILPTTYPHQSQQQQQYEEDYEDDNESYINVPRSRSSSRPRRISIAGGTVANKEFDIHFIPPTTMPTAFSTQQHNDIIIDFIGSAWEEVANSKVTKVYDGQ